MSRQRFNPFNKERDTSMQDPTYRQYVYAPQQARIEEMRERVEYLQASPLKKVSIAAGKAARKMQSAGRAATARRKIEDKQQARLGVGMGPLRTTETPGGWPKESLYGRLSGVMKRRYEKKYGIESPYTDKVIFQFSQMRGAKTEADFESANEKAQEYINKEPYMRKQLEKYYPSKMSSISDFARPVRIVTDMEWVRNSISKDPSDYPNRWKDYAVAHYIISVDEKAWKEMQRRGLLNPSPWKKQKKWGPKRIKKEEDRG
tara:strand:- start:2838 stop:3617 length:780 start_codon:yes stop_codon:yes gene_type:complete